MTAPTKAELASQVADLRQQVEALRAQLLGATSCWCACGCHAHRAVVGDYPQPVPQISPAWEQPYWTRLPQITCETSVGITPPWRMTTTTSGAAVTLATERQPDPVYTTLAPSMS